MRSPWAFWVLVLRTAAQNTSEENVSDLAGDWELSNSSNNTDDQAIVVVCYPKEDIAFRNAGSCAVKSVQPQKDWDKTSFDVLEVEVICDDFDALVACNTSEGVEYESGWPVHEDIVAAFWNHGQADWVQLMAFGILAWYVVSGLFALYVLFRFWDANPSASRDAMLQGFLRHLAAIVLVVLGYFSAWGSPRRSGWFYVPICPTTEQQDRFQLGFSFWCFVNSAVAHVLVCVTSAIFHTAMITRSLYPENIITIPEKEVPGFLQSVLDACPQCASLHGEEPDASFMWENGRTDDLRLKTWKEDLCKRSHNCLTLEIHIRPADTFSRGSIQSLGYSFFVKLKDMKPVKEGSVQVYQALVRSSYFFQRRMTVGMLLERFFANFFMLGFLHEIYFQHNGVDSACLRLEKRVRLLPQDELDRLCHDCYTLSNSHLTRVKDFKARALEGAKQAEAAGCATEAPDAYEEAVLRALSIRSFEKNQLVQGMESEGAWSKCAEVNESDCEDVEVSDVEEPRRSSSALPTVEPSRLGVPLAAPDLGGRAPANSPAESASSMSVKERWAKGVGSKEDWQSMVHDANIFILRSYMALSDREQLTRYVEEATRAFVDAWEYGSLNRDPIATQQILVKIRTHFNRQLHKALACLDLQSLDDLRAAAEGSGGSAPEIQLLDPRISKMMAAHSRYLLQMAMAVGDRKALALALVESSRLMGELPESELVPASPDRAEEPTELAPAEPAEPTSSPMVEPEIEREDSRERDSEGELAGFEEMSLVGGDPWLSLTADEGRQIGPNALFAAKSSSQLFQMAREMYRQKLFDDSRQLLLSDAARELLGDGQDHFGEAWMQQQLAVMRTKVGSLDSRAKREVESPKFLRSLQALFDLTTRQVITRDRQGKLPTRLKVVKAKRSVNLDAYRAYHARRAEIEAAMQGKRSARLDDCLTIGPTGCYLRKELRSLQGVWIDSKTGARWLVEGKQALRVAAVTAQLLDPIRAASIHDSEDFQELKPVQMPVPFLAAEGSDDLRHPVCPQFMREVKKRIKDDDDAEENPQDKVPVKARWLGWLDECGSRAVWYCEKTSEYAAWVRDANFQGVWRVSGSYALLLHPDGFREGAAFLDARSSRLRKKVSRSRRGTAWFDRELSILQEEGQILGESGQPPMLMHLVGELYPIWLTELGNGISLYSTTFKGVVDAEGTEICLEPVSEEERPNLANYRPKRTLLGRRTTHVVQPFLSQIWGYRQSATVDLSAKELNTKASELWLFHGTREFAAECITENEFQVKMAGSNRGTMFGPGIYLADSVTKSDEYTDPDPTGLRTMILCRCTMGRAIKQYEGGRECMKACHAGGYHSVKGLRAYNEYIVYDESQVYAEYIIWYRRVYNIE